MSLTRSGNKKQSNLVPQTLQNKLRANLQAKVASETKYPDTSALLLDISYSMDEWLGPNIRKIDELRKLVAGFQNVRRFEFSCTCEELKERYISEPFGGTAMDIAFIEVKSSGVSHVVLITDGMPDNEKRALDASKGLKIDVLYVGPDPAPEFLKKLCASTGGIYGQATLTARKELEGTIKGLLPAPGRVIQL